MAIVIRRIPWAVLCAVFCLGLTPAAKGPASISIKVEDDEVKRGSDIVLDITLENTSTLPIFVREERRDDAGELDYRIEVTGPNGRPASLTKEYGQNLYGTTTPNLFVIRRSAELTLNPGDESRVTATLNKIYDMSLPGVYKVRASRMVPNGGPGEVKIQSNTAIVTVSR